MSGLAISVADGLHPSPDLPWSLFRRDARGSEHVCEDGDGHPCRARDPFDQRLDPDPARCLLRRRARCRDLAGAGDRNALSIFSFGSALYAFSLMETAKVSALRETAVVFAALMGSLFLGESFGRRRVVAATALAAGLLLMQFG